MTRLAARLRTAYAAALLAVALLAFAGVKSTVMQVAEAFPAAAMPMCGMAMGSALDGALAGKPGKAHATCDFCVAAAHAPLPTAAVPVPAPAAVAYVAALPPGAFGPRGPPALPPRARGPPEPSLA